MKPVFVDALYWIAIVKRGDQYEQVARKARDQLGDVRLVTTDGCLAEFLAALARGSHLRKAAAEMVRAIMSNANVRVVPQTRDSFLRALRRYEERLDKGYTLTDCMSMDVMEEEGIQEALTHDHHFVQEGFTALIPN